MDNSAQMLIFAKVVEQGSISAAARSIGQTPSAVSKQVALLEDYVHHRLLNRTRTGVMPTQEGQQFYEKCKALADKYDEAEEMVRNMDGIPRGFMKSYPEVRLSLDLTDREIDLQGEGFDVAICFAEQHKNPDIVARRIMQSQRVLCAAPAYLLHAGVPRNFDELAQHNCLQIAGNRRRNSWNSGSAPGDAAFEANGSFEGNSTDVVFRAALAGIGIARLPYYMAKRKFDSGELIHVMPEYAPPGTDIVVMFAERRNLSPKTRAFVDFLVEQFRGAQQFHKSA